jgi:hypothetical protein
MSDGEPSGGGKPGAQNSDDDKSWARTLGLIASIAGLLAFLGVANYQDLVHRLFPQPPAPVVTTPATTPAPDPAVLKWTYIRQADAVCAEVTRKGADIPAVPRVTYAWMKRFLDLRHETLTAWQAVRWPVSSIDPVNAGELHKIWADFEEATNDWAAMMEDLRKNRLDDFNAHLGYHNTADASFVDGANRYGFSSCNHSFASVSPFR